MDDFSKRLLKAKRASGMTSAKIADALGVTERTVSSWMNGGKPSCNNMARLAALFRVTEEWLERGTVGAEPVASPRSVSAARLFDRLSDEQKAAIELLLRDLTGGRW